MAGNVATGFGYFSFGHAPFGTVSWGTELFDLIPAQIKDEDENTANGNLKKFTDAVVPELDFLSSKVVGISDLTDADAAPADLLDYLAANHGIVLEKIFSVAAQRGFIRNAAKWMVLKGTSQGYKIRGNVSGFEVEVTSLYRISGPIQIIEDLGHEYEIPPGSGHLYTDLDPTLAFFDEVPADLIPTDVYGFQTDVDFPPGTVFHDVSDCSWCRTAKLRILITVQDLDLQPGVSIDAALQSILRQLDDVTPVHVNVVQKIFQTEFLNEIDVLVTVETFGALTSNEPVVF